MSEVPEFKLVLAPEALAEMVAHCQRAFPEEGCGLLAGDPLTGRVLHCVLTRNAASSARLYSVDSRDLLRYVATQTNENGIDLQSDALSVTIPPLLRSICTCCPVFTFTR